MKTFLILSLTVFLLTGYRYTYAQDSIRIQDSWFKRDSSVHVLQDSLLRNAEMKILQKQPSPTRGGVRIISGSQEISSSPQENHESFFELKIAGKKRHKKSNQGNFRRFSGHVCGFNFGFVNFTNTDYSLYSSEEGEFMELDYANSFVMQFNLIEQSINFVPRNNFGMVFGLGLEYQRFRFDNSRVSIAINEKNEIVPRPLQPDWHVKKNSFKTLYLSIPVMFELQFPAKYRNRFYVSAGVMGGIRLLSRTKIVYRNADGHKSRDRHTDSYGLIPVKADAMFRLGYDSWNVWAGYTLTNMFRNNKGPELHPYSIGIGVSF